MARRPPLQSPLEAATRRAGAPHLVNCIAPIWNSIPVMSLSPNR